MMIGCSSAELDTPDGVTGVEAAEDDPKEDGLPASGAAPAGSSEFTRGGTVGVF